VSPSLPRVGEDFAGYRLRAVLGRGGMSVVFQAENPRLGSVVALKVLAPELATDDVFRARFLQESRLAASLNHPNVIPIYDTGPCEDLLYIAMRYVAGSDLRAVLKAHERIAQAQAVLLIAQAGRALDAAHRHGLVHRDVKPANFLIERGADDEPDHVYLADFGITKHALSRSGLTATGQFVGTIDYIAPEQIQGKSVDGRADIYSLGCVLYECLTGQVPFLKDLDAAVIWAHVEELPTAPSAVRPELPRGIDDVIARALAKDPNDRYATCRELADAARTVLEAGARSVAPTASDVGVTTVPQTVLRGGSAQRPVPHVSAASEVPGASSEVGESQGGPPTPLPSLAVRRDGGREFGGVDEPPSGDQPAGDRLAPSARPSGGWRRLAALGIVALVIAGGVIAWALSRSGGSARPGTKQAGESRSAKLAPVPTNHVHGAGIVMVQLNGNVATVTINAYGLLDGAPHAMHIHAGGLGTCPPASAARLHNGHLAISTADGIKYYGPPEASLTTTGDTSPASYLDFSRFPKMGEIRYRRQIQLSPLLIQKLRANLGVVVIHGIDYNSNGIYDNVLSHSELLPAITEESSAPALCGPLVAARSSGGVTASAYGRGSGGNQFYIAALTVETSSLRWLCEPPDTGTPRPSDAKLGSRRRAGHPTTSAEA
jgi:serine/threonine protein kinase